MAENYLAGVKPVKEARDSVLIDIDDFVPSSSYSNDQLQYRFIRNDGDHFPEETKDMKSAFILKLYTKLQVHGWPLVLISRNPEKEWNATTEYLISNGYGGWSSLIMRLEEEMEMDNNEYFTKVLPSILQKQNFRIAAVISCRLDILTALFSGSRLFMLPNPIHHAFLFAQ